MRMCVWCVYDSKGSVESERASEWDLQLDGSAFLFSFLSLLLTFYWKDLTSRFCAAERRQAIIIAAATACDDDDDDDDDRRHTELLLSMPYYSMSGTFCFRFLSFSSMSTAFFCYPVIPYTSSFFLSHSLALLIPCESSQVKSSHMMIRRYVDVDHTLHHTLIIIRFYNRLLFSMCVCVCC